MKRLLPVAFLVWLAFAGGAWADTCQYNVTPPSVGNGKQAQVQCDSSGRLISSGGGAGTYADASAATSTSAATVFAANTSRVRIKLINTDFVTASGGGGIVIWCRWGTSGAAPAAAHGVKSFPLFPGGGIDDQGVGVNQSAVNCIAESGTPVLFAEQY